MVVDLRHLRIAAYLAQAAAQTKTTDADFLMDEAVSVANGNAPFLSVDDNAVPVLSDWNLLVFQEVNDAYRAARDTHLTLSQRLVEAQQREAVSRESVSRLSDDLNAPGATDDDKARTRRLYDESVALESRLRDELDRAGAETESAQNAMAWANSQRRLALTNIVVPVPLPMDVLTQEHAWVNPGWEDRLRHKALSPVRDLISEMADDRFGKAFGFSPDPALQSRADALVARLQTVSPYMDEPKAVRVLDHGNLAENAVAMGDNIYIGRKLLESGMSDDALLFVVGHEMAHIDRDHVPREIPGVVGEDLRGWVSRQWPNKTTLSPAQQAWLQRQVTEARIGDIKKPHESEADREGALLALAAGAKPEGIRESFRWMVQGDAERFVDVNVAEQRRLGQLDDHPKPQDRYSDLVKIYGPALLENLQ
jgi:hypothetical protein